MHIQILMPKKIKHKLSKTYHIQILVFKKNMHKLFNNYAPTQILVLKNICVNSAIPNF